MKRFTLTTNTIEALTRYCLPVAENELKEHPTMETFHGVHLYVVKDGLGAKVSGYCTDQYKGVFFEDYPANAWESDEHEGTSYKVFLSIAALKAIKAAASPYAIYGAVSGQTFTLTDARTNMFYKNTVSEAELPKHAPNLQKLLKQEREYKGGELVLGYKPDKIYQTGRKEKTALKMSVLSMLQERLKELSQVKGAIVTLTINPCKPIQLFSKQGYFTYSANSEYEPDEAPYGLEPVRFDTEYLAWCLRGKASVTVQTNTDPLMPWLFQHKVNGYGTDLVNIMLMPCAKER